MSRISCQNLAEAISTVQAMDLKTKEQLADEIYRTQPNMLASVIVLGRFGVSMEKIDFALKILLICFTAMKISGLVWPLITEDEQERQLRRFTAQIQFSSNLNDSLLTSSVQQYVEGHAEQTLLAYISTETTKWLGHIVPENQDKYVILSAWNLANCIAVADVILP